MDEQVLTDQQRLIVISSVQTLDAVKETDLERLTIGAYSDRESRIYTLSDFDGEDHDYDFRLKESRRNDWRRGCDQKSKNEETGSNEASRNRNKYFFFVLT